MSKSINHNATNLLWRGYVSSLQESMLNVWPETAQDRLMSLHLEYASHYGRREEGH